MASSVELNQILRLRSTVPDNRILFLTRFVAGFIVPVLITAFVILYLYPQHTGDLFAWPIKPSMNAMMLGGTYAGGVYFFSRAFIAHRWSEIKLSFLPISVFTAFLGIATVLHWDKFTAGHVSFIAWAALYLTLPFALPLVWWLNRPADPITLLENDVYLPKNIERFFMVMGVFLVALSVGLMIVPDVLISVWPWTLTPLTARVMGAMFALPGLVGVGIARDKRWSSARLILQSQIFSLAFILLAMVISRADFDWSQLNSWLFALSMTGFFVLLIAIYAFMERLAKPQ